MEHPSWVGIGRGLKRTLAVSTLLALLPACVGGELGVAGAAVSEVSSSVPNEHPEANVSGKSSTFSTMGSVDMSGPFFQDLGANGRVCASCHVIDQGWTITPSGVQARFDATDGLDPIFRTNDGSNSPNADISTLAARRAAYSMLLSKGLVRVGLPIPAGAEFALLSVSDPYGYASAAELSLFRRPLPTTNLRFVNTVMWDGRENTPGNTFDANLLHQANSATVGHAQRGTAISAAEARAIVDFELALTTAQTHDDGAKGLAAAGAHANASSPAAFLSTQLTYPGINDLFGDAQTGAPFNPVVFDVFDAWASINGNGNPQTVRRSVQRGQVLFNTRQFAIAGVSGINDEPAFGMPTSIVGTCTTCHDTPNAGSHSVPAPLNIGVADASRRTADMPLYTLVNLATGATVQTTDPGRALVTGRWSDIGRFKGPVLRGLAARAPYFHNGAAATLDDVVTFYVGRFGVALSASERADLVAFLRSL